MGAKTLRLAALPLLAWLAAMPAWAGDDDAGRHHAAKGNHLAALNNCKGAIVSFSRAYDLLHDPSLLFNRAECLRKLDRNAEAIKDYERFLAELPSAPNRKNVEARLASLRGAVAAAKPTTAKPGTGKPVAPAKSPTKPTGAVGSKQNPKATESSASARWED
jgi:tetratricopeptide (TPR) repeat protein